MRRSRTWAVGLSVVVTGAALLVMASGPRTEPRCAVLDCRTGTVVEDGCASGVCLKCALPCLADGR